MKTFLEWLEANDNQSYRPELYHMVLIILDNESRKMVTSAIKQMRIKPVNRAADGEEWYSYTSKAAHKADTGEKDPEARFSLSMTRQRGRQLLDLLEQITKTAGYTSMFQAGIDAYFD